MDKEHKTSLLELLPHDVLGVILQNVGSKNLSSLLYTSSRLSKFLKVNLKFLLCVNLSRETRLNLDTYNLRQLTFLSKISINKNISSGSQYSLVLNSLGQVYSFGDNQSGQLGLGNTLSIHEPTLNPYLDDIVQISAGCHSLVLTEEGQVYSFGSNDSGQLGVGTIIDIIVPTLIPNLNNIISISATDFHTLILNDEGRVYSFGSNEEGQLGRNDNHDRNIPTLISNLNDIVQISSGTNHSLVLNNLGQVYSFGDNYFGQLGLDDIIYTINIPTLIPDLHNIVQISAGSTYSLALNNEGKVYSFGENKLDIDYFKYLSVPTIIGNLNDIIQISCGNNYALLLNDTGQVYVFGRNEYGQLGIGNNLDLNIPTLNPYLNNIVQVSAGDVHSLVLNNKGQIYTFGYDCVEHHNPSDINYINIPILIHDINQ